MSTKLSDTDSGDRVDTDSTEKRVRALIEKCYVSYDLKSCSATIEKLEDLKDMISEPTDDKHCRKGTVLGSIDLKPKTGMTAAELREMLRDIDDSALVYLLNQETGARSPIVSGCKTDCGHLDLTYACAEHQNATWCITAVDAIADDGAVYWSNEHGWVSANPTLFTDEERSQYQLPVGGKWMPRRNSHTTILKFVNTYADGYPDVCLVAIHKVLDETTVSAIFSYWKELQDDAADTLSYPDDMRTLISAALEKHQLTYEYIEEDYTDVY